MADTLGSRFAHALAVKDRDALRALLADDVDFKGLTPGRLWEATGPDEVLEVVLGSWFEDSDSIERVVEVSDGDTVADTAHVSYRFDLRNPDGDFVAEQQAYYRGGDAIEHLRVMCSGFRPR
ncbi:nuclear transport factor 2 family protein [Nocardioides sp. J2M5]|uniref:nuclear transport factor 2 family protein n=1 Tax=Nocardioides palaemonis TaxID=2829810 RepID=UPI001BA9B32C|nr:nuclear transport factor 2 family protein [Nocardioides palaemonis]MBS2939225.1 nuclear transport factor 2 family protein [Nocardioides palaemonis]